jgi:hypothetical protein
MQSRKQTTGSLNAEMQRTLRIAEENKLCETLRSPRLCVEYLRKKKQFRGGQTSAALPGRFVKEYSRGDGHVQ